MKTVNKHIENFLKSGNTICTANGKAVIPGSFPESSQVFFFFFVFRYVNNSNKVVEIHKNTLKITVINIIIVFYLLPFLLKHFFDILLCVLTRYEVLRNISEGTVWLCCWSSLTHLTK